LTNAYPKIIVRASVQLDRHTQDPRVIVETITPPGSIQITQQELANCITQYCQTKGMGQKFIALSDDFRIKECTDELMEVVQQ
jgi:predicted ATP-dependent Lon-type protease